MVNVKILDIVTFLYLLSSTLYVTHSLFKKNRLGQLATYITITSLTGHTLAFVIRWIESYQLGFGHFHIINMYESLTFSVWAIVVIYMIIEFRIKTKIVGAFVLPLVSLIMIYASFSRSINSQINPVPVLLQGNFYNYHIIPCFLSYAAFTISFGASVVLFLKSRKITNNPSGNDISHSLPPLEVLDDINYKAIAIGFILFTFQMIAGIFRTKIVLGSYWSWNLMQTWALITWLIYAGILHGRFLRNWGEDRTALLSITGFITIIIGFLIAAGRIFSGTHYPIR